MLLCNFFNYIDGAGKGRAQDAGLGAANGPNAAAKDPSAHDKWESYIVYGEAIPIGECWFVARKHQQEAWVELWNPMTGECYNYDRTPEKTSSAVLAGAASSAG